MSDGDGRPAKRARLDEVAPASLAAPLASSVDTDRPSSKTAVAAETAAVDDDLEREIRAGITEYVCAENLGFRGVLKQRFTDFLVNEIGLDGQVLHLKSVDVGGRKKNGEETNKNGEKMHIEGASVAHPEPDGKTVEAKPENAGVENTNGHGATKEEKEDVVEVWETFMLVGVILLTYLQPSEEDLSTLHSIFGESTTSEILSLVRAIRKHENKKARDFKFVIASPIADKETRTRAHLSLRRIFPNLLESSMEADQSIRIKAVPPRDRKGKKKGKGGNRDNDRGIEPDRRRGGLAWEELGGEYLHFTLYKENKDTMEVIGFLGSKLGSGAKAFGFAGTKDRRACTVQRVSVKRQTAERMNGFNNVLFNAAIGDYSYQNRQLGLGDLLGNEFTITLRDCHFEGEDGLVLSERRRLANDIVSKAITDFSERGFINYYGLQRFGSFSASTDTVGLKMLQGDLKGAVGDLLSYSDVALAAAENPVENSAVLVSQDDRNRAKALHIWKTKGKGSVALDMLPRKFSAERNIIQHLSSRNSKSGKYDRTSDWQGALMCIPRNLRLMYVHAYQSLVWNIVAGKRWTTYGDKVVQGDLVLVHEHKDKEASSQPAPRDDIDQDGEAIINPSGSDSAFAIDDQFERARPLTAEEAASGKYTIFDVVLPQPGFDVEYPKNEIGRFYEEFMGSERGGGLDPHNMRRTWREVSLSGGYRKFLARPLRPLEFDVRDYEKPEEQFVETDLERVKKGAQKLEAVEKDTSEVAVERDADVDMVDEGQRRIAVVLKMQLGTSQYATVALRELMKPGGVKAYKPEFMGGR